MMSSITHPHVVPNPKTFIHLHNTNEDMFFLISEQIQSNPLTLQKVQRVCKSNPYELSGLVQIF